MNIRKKIWLFIIVAALMVGFTIPTTTSTHVSDSSSTININNMLKTRQNEVHEAAELLRSLNISNDNEAIKALADEWWLCQNIEYLACAIYQEGGGDAVCDECRYRIGDVILTRVKDSRFPNTIQEVLTQKSQYGRLYWTGIIWPERASNPNEQAAVQRAYETAYNLLKNIRHSDIYEKGYVYQAEFKQGNDIVKHCGIYFGK